MTDSSDSLQAVIRQRQHAGFVGRESWLALFRDNLALPADDGSRKFVFAIHGDGGVGKTFLLKRMVKLSAESGWLTAVTDETAYDVLEVMAAVSGQLNRQGVRLKRFEQRYDRYRKRQHELEAGSSSGNDAASLVTQTVVRMGVGAARTLPGGGAVTEFIDPRAAAESTDILRAAIAKKLRSRDDVRLVLSPIEELTPVFVEGLKQLDKPVALFFDTYERTSSFLDRWLRNILSDMYGPLPVNLMITVAGRSALDSSKWSAYLKIIQDVPLMPFTDMEVRQLLAVERVTDEHVVSMILKESGGLPLAVAMLAENQPGSGWTPSEVSATVVERFLQWEDDPARREIALAAALPRRIDEDVLAVLANPASAPGLYDWLVGQPFVTLSDGRCQYHDVVREPMIRLTRGRSPQRWRQLHNTLADSYQRWREQLSLSEETGWSDSSWQRYMMEEMYHRLCADPGAALPDAIDAAVEACRREVTVARRWADMVAQAGRDADAASVLGLGRSVQDALSADEGGEIRFLDEILQESRLSVAARANAHRERGRQYRLAGRYEQALVDFDRAIDAKPQYSEALSGRGETYRLMGRYEEALADFDRAIDLEPEDEWTIASRGETYQSMDRYEEALADFSRAIDLDPEIAYYIAIRGEMYRLMDRHEEALADFDRAIDLDSEYAWAIGSRGQTYRALGNNDAALADFDRALSLDSEMAWVIAERGRTHRAVGHHAQAAADFNRAVELDPLDLNYQMERALTHGIDHTGANGFQLIADVEATPQTAALLARMITGWLVSVSVMEPERTVRVPGTRGGHAPGPARGRAVAEPFPAEDLPGRLCGIVVFTGRAACHQLTLDTAGCPSCGERIALRQSGELTPFWSRVIDAITLWENGGIGILRCPTCAEDVHLHDWQFDPPCAFAHLVLLFWNWPPLADSFISDVSHQLAHRVIVFTGTI